MDKKITLVTILATILLIMLLVVLAIFRTATKREDSTTNSFAPTTAPINYGSVYNKLWSSPTPVVSTVSQEALFSFQNLLPYNSDALSIDYSSLTNKIYIEKKNNASEEELQQFLEKNNLLNLYHRHPELFVITSSNLKLVINSDEQKIEFDPEEEAQTPVMPTSVRNPNDPFTQTRPLANTFKTLMGFNSHYLPPTPTVQTPRATPTNAPVAPVKINYGKDTSNIPCAAGTDYGPADGYTNGVLTRIRTCRVAGMVVNSQVSKQLNDMHSAWVAAGIPLTGGGFRTMSGQIAIYQNWCKSDGIVGSPPPYPKPPGQTIRCPGGGAPGYSNHQMGMAIDFNCAGSLIPRKYAAASQNKCFQWLVANAGKFGFFEYGYGRTRDGSTGYEGWHWSVNGN